MLGEGEIALTTERPGVGTEKATWVYWRIRGEATPITDRKGAEEGGL